MPPFQTRRRVDFADTDMAGIVHFSNFFRYMEAAEAGFLRSRGLSFNVIWEGQQLGFPRVSAACDYLSPARFDEVLDIAVSLANIGRTSLTYTFAFSHQGRPVAKGKVTCVCCRVGPDDTFASAEIPQSLRAVLAAEPAP